MSLLCPSDHPKQDPTVHDSRTSVAGERKDEVWAWQTTNVHELRTPNIIIGPRHSITNNITPRNQPFSLCFAYKFLKKNYSFPAIDFFFFPRSNLQFPHSLSFRRDMEASGAVLRQSTVVTGEGWLSGRRGRVKKGVVSLAGGRFVDDGHLRYYVSCGGKKEEKKKRAKLVKGLEKDLSALYSIGFGVEPEHGLTGEIQSKMFSEAAEVLLKQLKQLRVEEEEMKRKRKEEKAAKKAAKKMMKEKEDDDSESSCSSGSECCSATMELKSPPETLIPRKEAACNIVSNLVIEEKQTLIPRKEACNIISNLVIEEKQTGPMNKIEVCMGGKCKRSGAMQLLEEIDKKVGVEGAVVGCKCMGKCRDGPNVRVLKKDGNEEETLKQGRNPLYLGVGLEDVGAIVSNFFVEKKDLALSSA